MGHSYLMCWSSPQVTPEEEVECPLSHENPYQEKLDIYSFIISIFALVTAMMVLGIILIYILKILL